MVDENLGDLILTRDFHRITSDNVCYTNLLRTTEDKNRIHIQMWNGYQVPAYIIIEKSSVSIFDSRKRPKEENDDYAKELLTLTGQALRNFRAKDFDSGLFWDEQDEKKDRITSYNVCYTKLLRFKYNNVTLIIISFCPKF